MGIHDISHAHRRRSPADPKAQGAAGGARVMKAIGLVCSHLHHHAAANSSLRGGTSICTWYDHACTGSRGHSLPSCDRGGRGRGHKSVEVSHASDFGPLTAPFGKQMVSLYIMRPCACFVQCFSHRACRARRRLQVVRGRRLVGTDAASGPMRSLVIAATMPTSWRAVHSVRRVVVSQNDQELAFALRRGVTPDARYPV